MGWQQQIPAPTGMPQWSIGETMKIPPCWWHQLLCRKNSLSPIRFFFFFSFNSGFLLYCFYYRLHINWSACLTVASGVGGWEGHRGSVRRRSQIEKEEEKEEENRRGGCIWRSGNKPNQADKIRSSSEYLTCCNIIISWVVDGEHGARSQHNTQTPRASCTALQKAECQHILHSE